MDKEEQETLEKEISDNNSEIKTEAENKVDTDPDPKEETNEQESSPEEKIKELEDKLARTFAEMENQRRRFEKEKEDAFEYGGTSFAKEALNLIDNLERSKHVLKNDEKKQELLRELQDWQKSTEAPIPTEKNPAYRK